MGLNKKIIYFEFIFTKIKRLDFENFCILKEKNSKSLYVADNCLKMGFSLFGDKNRTKPSKKQQKQQAL